MADNAITWGGIGVLGSLVYICVAVPKIGLIQLITCMVQFTLFICDVEHIQGVGVFADEDFPTL